jgi:hypothetical protein
MLATRSPDLLDGLLRRAWDTPCSRFLIAKDKIIDPSLSGAAPEWPVPAGSMEIRSPNHFWYLDTPLLAFEVDIAPFQRCALD